MYASLASWDRTLDQANVGGTWSSLPCHINLLEFTVVQKVLHHFDSQLTGKHIMVRSDSTTVAAYLNKQGGIKFLALHRLAVSILIWADRHLRSLKNHHVPGSLNVRTGVRSRTSVHAHAP